MTARDAGSLGTSALPQALLFTRASPKLERAQDWDTWEVDKHMYDLVRAPGLLGASMYRRSTEGVPSAFRAGSRRAVVYYAQDVDSMRLWLASDELAEAVDDGRTWRDAYDPVDDEWFTGNVYRIRASYGSAPSHPSPILMERFEVPPESTGAFERWFDAYVTKLADLEGIGSVQSFDVMRDIDNVLYLSAGSHAVQVTFIDGGDPVATLCSEAAAPLIDASMAWERSLAYQTRELFTLAAHVPAPDGQAG